MALDTSALMAPVELDLRVFDELNRLFGSVSPIVPKAVLAELDRLAGTSGRESRAARVGRDLAERCRIVDTNEQDGDDALLELAATGETEYVVTTDRPLRDRLLETGTPVIEPRGSQTLKLTEP